MISWLARSSAELQLRAQHSNEQRCAVSLGLGHREWSSVIRARRRHGELCMLAHQRAGLDGRDAALQFGTPSAESHLGAELMGVAPANARLSMVRCLPSDAMTLVRDSAFLCATASSCTRWPVACRHLLIVSEFMLSDCLAEVHESRSWTVLPSMSSSSVSGGSVAGLLRDMRHRDRLRERRCECPRHRRRGERERSRSGRGSAAMQLREAQN